MNDKNTPPKPGTELASVMGEEIETGQNSDLEKAAKAAALALKSRAQEKMIQKQKEIAQLEMSNYQTTNDVLKNKVIYSLQKLGKKTTDIAKHFINVDNKLTNGELIAGFLLKDKIDANCIGTFKMKNYLIITMNVITKDCYSNLLLIDAKKNNLEGIYHFINGDKQ